MESATLYAPGTVRKGNDSRNWVVAVASNGTHRWMPKSGLVKKISGLWDPENYFYKSMKEYLDSATYNDVIRYSKPWEQKLIPAARELAKHGILLIVKPIVYGDPGTAEDDLEDFFTKNEKKYAEFLLKKTPKYALNISDRYAFLFYLGIDEASDPLIFHHNLNDPKLRQITHDVLSRQFEKDYKWNKSLRHIIMIRSSGSVAFPAKDFIKPLVDKLKTYDPRVKILKRGSVTKPATAISFSIDPEKIYKLLTGFGLKYHEAPDVDEDSFCIDHKKLILYVNFYEGIALKVYEAIHKNSKAI